MADASFEEIKQQIREWIQCDYIVPEDIPSIELYMDQVTTFMDKNLSKNKRTEDDKTLTKTMINNYTKNGLLPPPEKKKYSKNHIIFLIYIYYLKNFISISDIKDLLTPMIDTYYDPENLQAPEIFDIYNTMFHLEQEHYQTIKKSAWATYDVAAKAFPDSDDAEDEYLRNFAYITLLSYDIYLKKQIIEKIIDDMTPDDQTTSKKKKEKTTTKKSS